MGGFGLGARPGGRLRSWSEAGGAALALERSRLCDFDLKTRAGYTTSVLEQNRLGDILVVAHGYNDLTYGVGQIKFQGYHDQLENFGTDRRKFRPQRPAGGSAESHIVHIAHIAKRCMVCIVSYIRVLVSETLPWPTCARRSKISGQTLVRAKSEFRVVSWTDECQEPTRWNRIHLGNPL